MVNLYIPGKRVIVKKQYVYILAATTILNVACTISNTDTSTNNSNKTIESTTSVHTTTCTLKPDWIDKKYYMSLDNIDETIEITYDENSSIENVDFTIEATFDSVNYSLARISHDINSIIEKEILVRDAVCFWNIQTSENMLLAHTTLLKEDKYGHANSDVDDFDAIFYIEALEYEDGFTCQASN